MRRHHCRAHRCVCCECSYSPECHGCSVSRCSGCVGRPFRGAAVSAVICRRPMAPNAVSLQWIPQGTRLCKTSQKEGSDDEIVTYEQNDEMLCGYSRCCCLYVLFCGSRLANNHGDTAWSAYMKGWQTYDTPNRQKQDASSAYIKANSVTGNHLIRAWALSFSNGDVGSDTVQFTTGQGRFISQYAYGWNGYKPRQIHLRLQNAGSYAGTTFAQGGWSPDSV